MKPKYIDMHIHSTNSDGILTPEQVIEQANINNVEIISITDHDCIPERKVYQNLTINNKNIKLIPGAELSTDYYKGNKKIRIHLLAYDAIDENGELRKALLNMKKARFDGNYAYIKMLLKKLSFLDAEDFKNFDYSKFGWIKKLILAQIDIKKYNDYQQKILLACLDNIKPIYPKCTLDIEEGIDLVKKSQGFSSFAHPYQTGLELNELNGLVNDLKSMGLDAIETFHAMATTNDNEIAKVLANRYELFESCGSDFHSFGEKGRKQIGLGVCQNMKIESSTLANELILKKKFYFCGKYMGEDR